MSLRPPPILLVYNKANLIGVDPSMHSSVYDFVIDLAILQKYYYHILLLLNIIICLVTMVILVR